VIVNGMSEVNVDAQLVKAGDAALSRTDETFSSVSSENKNALAVVSSMVSLSGTQQTDRLPALVLRSQSHLGTVQYLRRIGRLTTVSAEQSSNREILIECRPMNPKGRECRLP
jgi:hypothetical protein